MFSPYSADGCNAKRTTAAAEVPARRLEARTVIYVDVHEGGCLEGITETISDPNVGRCYGNLDGETKMQGVEFYDDEPGQTRYGRFRSSNTHLFITSP